MATADTEEDVNRLTFNDVVPGLTQGPQITDAPLGLGKARTVGDLHKKEWVFIVLAGLSLVATMAVTLYKIGTLASSYPSSPDMLFAWIVLLSLLFCIFYLLQGIIQERPHEIGALVATNIVLWIYLVLNYALGQNKSKLKMIRLISVSAVSPFVIVLGGWIFKSYRDSGKLIFRLVGANSQMQDTCQLLFFFHALIKFNLQLNLSMLILMIHDPTHPTIPEIIIIGIGVPIVCTQALIGFLATRLENHKLTIIFFPVCLLQIAYMLYKIIDISGQKGFGKNGLEVPGLFCAVFALISQGFLISNMFRVWFNYGTGLKDKVYGIPEHNAESSGRIIAHRGPITDIQQI